VFSAGN